MGLLNPGPSAFLRYQNGSNCAVLIWVCCAAFHVCMSKMFARAETRTHDLLRIKRALYQLRQSSTFWAFVFVVYKLCSSYYMLFFGQKSSVNEFFLVKFTFNLMDNQFWFPAKLLHYRILNFLWAISAEVFQPIQNFLIVYFETFSSCLIA